MWAFVLFDFNDKSIETTLNKINLYYESKNYKKLFEKFSRPLIVSDDIENMKNKVKNCNLNEIHVQIEHYEHLKKLKL
ncbi:hypothetical protein AXF41_13600 [Clostridium haemolyticum]|uniref:hypothetical protein n=1 Tax=Clostridium haemolyticum TaxID=84025 RepID=UPI0009CCF75C|nr:hypothetical protein [Clostridium haemolyticum]OOB74986.1 hypothetical protein AXF41_13600 [Clostridium haemolyticum]